MRLKTSHGWVRLPSCGEREESIADIVELKRDGNLKKETSGEGLGVLAGMG